MGVDKGRTGEVGQEDCVSVAVGGLCFGWVAGLC